MRSINGMRTAYASNEIGEKIDETNEAPIKYEKIIVVVNDSGVSSFKWESPMKIDSIKDENVSLLPFNKIEEIVCQALVNKYSVEKEKYDSFTVKVYKIQMGLMRIKQLNSDSFCYIPVWNIFSRISTGLYPNGVIEEPGGIKAYDDNGNVLYLSDSFPEAWNPITLSAIDGTQIDRGRGY